MEDKNVGFVAMTADDACEFFERCIQKEAITLEERMAVLKELVAEKKALMVGRFDEKTSKAVNEFMEKTDHKGVIGFKKDK